MTKISKALKDTWKAKEAFYKKNKGLSIKQIIEKIENRTFNNKKST
ncbi:hypothetical protein ACFL56_02745 [Candidatus Margulisiibacteriota bacterium]